MEIRGIRAASSHQPWGKAQVDFTLDYSERPGLAKFVNWAKENAGE